MLTVQSTTQGTRREVKLQSLYHCGEMCGRTHEQPRGDLRKRAACRCLLPDFTVDDWQGVPLDRDAEALAHDLAIDLARRDEDLGFDLEADGCPNSYVLSAFAGSVLPYVGQRGWDSPRQQSLLFERLMRTDDEDPGLIFDAVELYQAHEDGAYARGKDMVDG